MKTYVIDKVNWSDEFPEKPEARVEVSNDHEKIYLHYYVKGEQLRAVTTEDQGPVWEDSCVEFFCQVPGDKYYTNFETNCIGAMVGTHRMGRSEGIELLSKEEMSRIKRRVSFPREVIEEKDGMFEWEVELEIPLELIFGDRKPVFPQKLLVNFYKCGDKTKKPHFVSWNPILVPHPEFHSPQFFGEMTLN